MAIIVLIIGLLFFWALSRGNKNKFTKRFLSVYLFLWISGIILSMLGVSDYYIPKERTVLVLVLHLFSFLLGYSIIKGNNVIPATQDSNYTKLLTGLLKIEKSKLFWFVFVIAFAYVVYLFTRFYASIIVASSVSEVRGEYFAKELFGEAFTHIDNLFLNPFASILIAVFSFKTFFKRDFIWVIIGLYLAFYLSLSGGRGEFVNLFLGIVFVYFCYGKRVLANKKSKFYLVASVLVLYFVVSLVTAGRSGEMGFSSQSFAFGMKETNKQVVEYVAGPIVAFDYATQSHIEEKNGGLKYGAMTASSLGDVIYYLSIITNKLLKTGIYHRPILDVDLQEQIYVGTDSRWNALYTSCIYYYLDFGFWGVILIPFFLGMIIKKIVLQFSAKNCFSLFILTSMIFIFLSDSILRFFLYRAGSLVLMAFLLLYGGKRSYKHEHNIKTK